MMPTKRLLHRDVRVFASGFPMPRCGNPNIQLLIDEQPFVGFSPSMTLRAVFPQHGGPRPFNVRSATKLS